MKKIAFLLALSICCGGVLCAQSPVKVGLKIGANYSNPSGVDFSDWSSDGTVRTGVGLTAGAFVKVNLPLTWLFVEAEALYSTYKQRVDPKEGNTVYKVKSEKVEFPVHVGIRLLKLIEVYAGPSFNYLSSSHTNHDDVNLMDARHGVKVAGDVGARVVIQKFSIDARYQFPFSGDKSFLENMGNTVQFKANPSLLTVSLGYSFL